MVADANQNVRCLDLLWRLELRLVDQILLACALEECRFLRLEFLHRFRVDFRCHRFTEKALPVQVYSGLEQRVLVETEATRFIGG